MVKVQLLTPYKTNECPEQHALGENEKEIIMRQEGVKEGLIKDIGEWLDPA